MENVRDILSNTENACVNCRYAFDVLTGRRTRKLSDQDFINCNTRLGVCGECLERKYEDQKRSEALEILSNEEMDLRQAQELARRMKRLQKLPKAVLVPLLYSFAARTHPESFEDAWNDPNWIWDQILGEWQALYNATYIDREPIRERR